MNNSTISHSIDYVSVIVPVRNEERFIEETLRSIVAQDYPADRFEVLVIDGMSEDRTREIIARISSKHSNIKLLDNPRRIVSAAMNIGIEKARGDVIIRVDGHCVLEPDYIRQCVNYLHRTGADNVGGLMWAVGQGYMGRVIAAAINSPFGSGGSKFHYSRKEQYVDTVYLGAFPRSVFERVGLFNEEMVCNQDYELNYRIRAAGGKIFLTPAIKSRYYGPSSLISLWRQYFRYGFWKLRMIKRHPRSIRPRHLAAPLFICVLWASGLLGFVNRQFLWPFMFISLSYLSASLASSFSISRRKGWRYLPLLPVAFATMHLSWGLGFVWSLLRVGRSYLAAVLSGLFSEDFGSLYRRSIAKIRGSDRRGY